MCGAIAATMLVRDFLLDREDVLQNPVVLLGPQVVAGERVDQLAGDPDATAARLRMLPSST